MLEAYGRPEVLGPDGFQGRPGGQPQRHENARRGAAPAASPDLFDGESPAPEPIDPASKYNRALAMPEPLPMPRTLDWKLETSLESLPWMPALIEAANARRRELAAEAELAEVQAQEAEVAAAEAAASEAAAAELAAADAAAAKAAAAAEAAVEAESLAASLAVSRAEPMPPSSPETHRFLDAYRGLGLSATTPAAPPFPAGGAERLSTSPWSLRSPTRATSDTTTAAGWRRPGQALPAYAPQGAKVLGGKEPRPPSSAWPARLASMPAAPSSPWRSNSSAALETAAEPVRGPRTPTVPSTAWPPASKAQLSQRDFGRMSPGHERASQGGGRAWDAGTRSGYSSPNTAAVPQTAGELRPPSSMFSQAARPPAASAGRSVESSLGAAHSWSPSSQLAPPAPLAPPVPRSPGLSASVSAGLSATVPAGRPCALGPEERGDSSKVVAGSFSMQGLKSAFPGFPNQDAYLVVPCGRELLLVACLDGHGMQGHDVSQRVKGILQEQALDLCQLPFERLRETFTSMFRQIQDLLDREGLSSMCGTTATVAVIDAARQVAFIAHVGDSKLIISRDSELVFETKDHIIDDEAEVRINACGGEVRSETYSGVVARRVFQAGGEWPGLSMARALGDAEAAAVGVICVPETQVVSFRPGSMLVAASDGVWEKLPPKEAVAFLAESVLGAANVHALAGALVGEACSRWPASQDRDDITAVVVWYPPAS